MNINFSRVKIIVTVPIENIEEVRNAICESGAGIIGNYTYCSMSTKCVGTFKPNDNANPYIGENNKLEFVNDDFFNNSELILTPSYILSMGTCQWGRSCLTFDTKNEKIRE